MLDKQGRLLVNKELIEKSNLKIPSEVAFYYDSNIKGLVLESAESDCDYFFVKTHKIDSKGRVFIPKTIKSAFPNCQYLPTFKDGKIYILII